jgi:hypothetical protein
MIYHCAEIVIKTVLIHQMYSALMALVLNMLDAMEKSNVNMEKMSFGAIKI